MFTVGQAMNIGELTKAKVVAGKLGLDRVIKYVTVMEVPDITQWLKGGDFIITSFYAIKDSIEDQCNIIKEFDDRNCAAIAIKTNRYIKSIAEEVISIADERNFPVIEIPREVTYIDIMTPLFEAILNNQNRTRIIEEFLMEIVHHQYKSRDSVIERGKSLGIQLDKGYFYTISVDIDNFDDMRKKYNYDVYKLSQIKEKFYMLIDGAVKNSTVKSSNEKHFLLRGSDNLTIFLQADAIKNAEKYGEKIMNSIRKLQSAYCNDIKLSIGVGNIGDGVDAIERGYNEAKAALRIGKAISFKPGIFRYKDVGIYDVLYGQSSEYLKSIISKCLGNVIEDKELIDTLKTYFEFNENINDASKKMFIHKNTLKYRLDRIKKISGLDIKDINDKVKLYLGIVALKILSQNTKIE